MCGYELSCSSRFNKYRQSYCFVLDYFILRVRGVVQVRGPNLWSLPDRIEGTCSCRDSKDIYQDWGKGD